MAKLYTLGNKITLFLILFLIGCTKSKYGNSSSIDVKTYSSEDKTDIPTTIDEIKDPETGKVVLVVKRK